MRRLTWDWRQVIAEGGLLFLHLDTELVLRNKPDRTHLIDWFPQNFLQHLGVPLIFDFPQTCNEKETLDALRDELFHAHTLIYPDIWASFDYYQPTYPREPDDFCYLIANARTYKLDGLDFGARPIGPVSSSGKYQILCVPQKHVRGRWERLATCRWLVCQKTFETFDQARSYVACWDEHDL